MFPLHRISMTSTPIRGSGMRIKYNSSTTMYFEIAAPAPPPPLLYVLPECARAYDEIQFFREAVFSTT